MRRVTEPASVPLLIFTDADTGRKVAINSGWMVNFTEGERAGTTLFRFMNGDLLAVEEDFLTVATMFAAPE